MTQQRKQATKPLTILIGADTFFPDINGAARFAERLAAGLVQRGHSVHIATPAVGKRDIGTSTETIEGEQMTVHRLPSVRFKPHEWLRFVWPWRMFALTPGLLDEVQPDVIHSQSHIVIGRALFWFGKKRGIRLVATNHVMPENIVDLAHMPQWLRSIIVKLGWFDADWVLRHADAITTPTRRAADFLEGSTRRRGVLPVSCGINATDYTPDLTPRSEQRVVFVGRMTQEKHVDVLLRAMALLPENVQLDLVGPGDQVPALQKLAAELGIADRITWHGRASDAKLRSVLTAASVFAIASIAELQSIATLEAMASGLPVVAADAMALPHLVEVGKNGYLFQPDDAAELARHIQTILQMPAAEFKQMQQESLRIVETHDIQRTLETFEKLYTGETV